MNCPKVSDCVRVTFFIYTPNSLQKNKVDPYFQASIALSPQVLFGALLIDECFHLFSLKLDLFFQLTIEIVTLLRITPFKLFHICVALF